MLKVLCISTVHRKKSGKEPRTRGSQIQECSKHQMQSGDVKWQQERKQGEPAIVTHTLLKGQDGEFALLWTLKATGVVAREMGNSRAHGPL